MRPSARSEGMPRNLRFGTGTPAGGHGMPLIQRPSRSDLPVDALFASSAIHGMASPV